MAADHIRPLNMNGLAGRMLQASSTKKTAKKELLVLYGHHALLERWWGLVQNLQDYGNVTMPDLPGFGGMDSFERIGQKPTIDAYADYLAAFVKLTYRRKRITIIGISFGFVVATRMLQKYPELARKVDLVVSMAGFMHKDDFVFTPLRRSVFRRASWLFARKPVAWLIRYGGLNKTMLSLLYANIGPGKRRYAEIEPMVFSATMEFEVRLWQSNDVRTHWMTTHEFLDLDNCTDKIDLPVWHVAASHDQYFKNEYVAQHMQVVFSNYHRSTMKSNAHMPSILGDKKEMSVMVPGPLKRALRKKA